MTALSTDAPARRPIRPLPDLLVNQIAAGEVVDRPASVVKELVENALDAGAARIRVELEQGGIELVRVSDDGCGIPPGQLALALAPHATSKIAAAADLERIATLGFRGEALASIASVARVSLRSRTHDDAGASVIDAEGAQLSEVRPAAGPIGTSIAVRNLFFNTPARRKFLRTPPTEQSRCVDALRDLAMANPGVGFTAVCDGRVSVEVPPGQSPRERALAILGAELADQMIEVHADGFDDSRGIALWGLAGTPPLARATNQAQHVFLNGRVIRDKSIQHAIKEAYRGLIEPGRHPTCVLMLEMDAAAVDVNVHPAKTEVRFRDSGLVHSVVLRAIRDALRSADLTPVVGGLGGAGFDPRAILPRVEFGGQAPPPASAPPSPQVFVDYFRRTVPERTQGNLSYEALRAAMQEGPEMATGETPGPPPALPRPSQIPDLQSPALPVPRPAERVLQVHKSYLVTEDDQGVVIVDQHALHERVMFEALVARIRESPLESQRLLAPAVVPAAPAQVERLADLRPLLDRIGVEAEAIGPAAVAVHAFPTFLFGKGVDPVEFMTELLERAEADGFAPGSEQTLHEVLDMMACKAAVKAGDGMSEIELAELLRLREAVERSSNCPHGRPTSVRLTIRELERLFARR
jgi:DNA mismatch repair protein MutL